MCDDLSAQLDQAARCRATRFGFVVLTGIVVSLGAGRLTAAESDATELVLRPAMSDSYDPFESEPPAIKAPTRKRSEQKRSSAPVDAGAYLNYGLRVLPRQVKFQTQSTDTTPSQSLQTDLAKDPCAAMAEKPLAELGIGIALPAGTFPDDPATACWNQLNQSAGPLAALRGWPTLVYHWDATCLCHRPLYFEQINLERHGYGCPDCLQAGVSAAHFFATVPALPYCMAVECPCECVYTLGHYRPGSCPPWRHHWPPCSPLAAAAEGGVWTGMIFLIP